MKPMSLNLSKMKKVASDQNSSTFVHPNGHKITISHHGISSLQKKQIEQLPIHKMAQGGDAVSVDTASAPTIPDQFVNPSPGSSAVKNDVTQATPTPPDQYGIDPEEFAKQREARRGVAFEAPEVDLEPQTQAPTPTDPMLTQSTASDASLQKEKNAILAGAAAQGKISQQDAKEWGAFSGQIDQMSTPQQVLQNHKAADDKLLQAYMSKSVDPDHYWKNKSTGQKIASAIGLILGGIGSAHGQPNYAMENINNAISQDIEAQKNDQSKSMNLWKMNREATENEIQANLATHNQLLNAVKAKIMRNQAQYGSDIARANVAPTIASIDQQMNHNNMVRAMLSAGQGSASDPSKLVPLLVPKEHQAKAFGEIEAAENTKKMASSIMKSFDDAAKDNTVMKTGAGLLRTPPSVYALHQSMQPTFKDLEGTVRQAAMDNTFKNITPMPGDLDSTVQTKRKALEEYLQSKMSAPTARGYGIDLSRFPTTSAYSAPEVKTMNGVQYQKVQGGWKRVQ